MSRKRMMAALEWVVAALSASVVGGAPMGPPMGVLEEGQWSVGVEYGYQETDLQAYGTQARALRGASPTYTFELLEIRGLQASQVFGNVAYGVCDNWDLFLRLGVTDAQGDIAGGSMGQLTYDGDHGLAWGIGTRATFCQRGPWSFGGLTQVTWLDPGDSDFSAPDPDTAGMVSVGSIDVDMWRTQVGLAAVYQIDTFRFWAGPFLQFIEGGLDTHGRVLIDGIDSGSFRGSSDIEERSQAGIHFGTTWEMSNELNWWIESRLTGDSWSVGLGGVILPERLFNRR